MFSNDDSSQQTSMSQEVSEFSNRMNNQPTINFPTFNTQTMFMNKYLKNNMPNIFPSNNIHHNNQLHQNINHINYIPSINHF